MTMMPNVDPQLLRMISLAMEKSLPANRMDQLGNPKIYPQPGPPSSQAQLMSPEDLPYMDRLFRGPHEGGEEMPFDIGGGINRVGKAVPGAVRRFADPETLKRAARATSRPGNFGDDAMLDLTKALRGDPVSDNAQLTRFVAQFDPRDLAWSFTGTDMERVRAVTGSQAHEVLDIAIDLAEQILR